MALTKTRQRMVFGETINVKDFGATGDGSTDDTSAFQSALTALTNGGVLIVPIGRYKLSDTLTLKTGMSIVGEGDADRTFGTPNTNAVSSYIFQPVASKSVFKIAGNTRQVKIQNLSFGTKLTPDSGSPVLSTGIDMADTYPNSSTDIKVSGCQFYNFGTAVSVSDNALPHANPDWQCDGVSFDHCLFFMNTESVYFNTENADGWKFSNCQFQQGNNADSVKITRAGYMTFIDSFWGNIIGSPTASYGIRVASPGIFDTINIISSQYENLTSGIQVDTSYYPNRPIGAMKIIMNGSIGEAPTIIDDGCNFVSVSSRYTYDVTISGDDVIAESYSDEFQGTTLGYVVTGSNSSLYNAITSSTTSLAQTDGYILGGRIQRVGSAIPTSGTFNQGDITWNSNATAGGTVGWVCVTAGTPGTWKSFGTIAS
jgi:hypothetical protein